MSSGVGRAGGDPDPGAQEGACEGACEGVGMSTFWGSGAGSAGPGEDLVSPRNPSAVFMRFLIFLVTTIASMTQTITAPRHRACQTQDGMPEGKEGYSAAQEQPVFLIPVPGCGLPLVPLRPSNTCCDPFCCSPEKEFWKWWVLLPVMASRDS